MLKEGNKLFYEEKYSEASTYFQQLLSINQSNPEYNYKYGTCLLFTDGDKAKALGHLVFAVTKSPTGLDKELYYNVARAYHLNYRFSEAIKYYQKYAAVASSKEKEKYQIDRQIEMCNNGKKLLRNVTDLVVEDKKSYRELDFFRLYDLSKIGGKILVVDELATSQDKKNNHRPVVHLPKNSDIVFFASYGDNGRTGKDIYRVKRLPGGTWSQPQLVGGSINTPYDEDYPYMHPDGRTFYFCSKGHNSMGGYDVFQCSYDPETETFGTPVNVDFAISTPDDDFLYIVDSLNQRAYFASRRESGIGNVNVYSVRVERIPVLTAIIKGKFINQVNPESKSTSIAINNTINGEMEALVNTKSTNGDYLIVLDRPGKYMVKVKGSNGEMHEAVLEIPYLRELRPLKQEIVMYEEDGTEKIKLVNKFNEAVDDADEIIAMVLKDKSSLNPNASQIPDSVLNSNKNNTGDIVADAVYENMTNEQLLQFAREEIENLKKEAQEQRDRSDAAYSIADQKLNESRRKAEQAEENIKEASKLTDPLEKQQLLDNAASLNNESQRLSNEAVTAFNVGSTMEKQYQKTQNDVAVSEKYYKGVQDALNTSNHDEAVKKLREQQEFIKDIMSSDANKVDRSEEIRREANDKRAKSNQLIKDAQTMRQEETTLNNKLERLKREAEKAKGKDKEKLEQEIKETQSEIDATRDAITQAYRKSENLSVDADQLEREVDFIHSLEEGSLTADNKLSEEDKKNLFNKIQNNDVVSKIENNRIKIDESTDQNRNDRYDLNDYLAKHEKYANLLREQNRYNIRSMTSEEYRKYLQLQDNWQKTIDDNIAQLEAEAKKTDDKTRQKEIRKELNTLRYLKEVRDKERRDVEANKDNIVREQGSTDVTQENTNKANPELTSTEKYQDKIKQIDNSNASNTRKEADKAKVNRETITAIDNRINQLTNEMAVSDKQKQDEIRKEIAALEVDKKKRQDQLTENNKQLEKKGVSNTTGDQSYSDIGLTKDQALNQQLLEDNKKREELRDLQVKRSETTDKSEQDKLDAEIKKRENEILQNETQLGEKLADNSKRELSETDTRVTNKLDELNKTGFNDRQEINRIESLMTASATEQRQAQELRNKASRETDPSKKNELLKDAYEKERKAVNLLNQADAIIESNLKKNTSNVSQQGDVVKNVDPDYENRIASIENNTSISREEKNNQKVIANNALLQKINDRLDQLDSRIPNTTGDEKNKLEEERRQLVNVRKEKERENQDLKVEAVTETHNDNLEKNIMPDYNEKKKSIENSPGSEVSKDRQLRELDEQFISNTENQIRQIEKEIPTLSPEEQRRRKLKIEELNRLMDAKRRELNIKDGELAKKGINPSRGTLQVNENTYESPAARNEARNLAALNEQIDKERRELIDLQVKLAESTDETEKKNLQKQIDAKTKSLVEKENKLATALDKANDAEFRDAQARNESRRRNADNVGDISSTVYTEAENYEKSARDKMDQADQLRLQADKEKDPVKKRELLVQALELEKQAIREMRKAGTLYDMIVSDGVEKNKTSEKRMSDDDNSRMSESINPGYNTRKQEIDNASDAQLVKEVKRNELERETVDKIEKQINALQKDMNLLSPEEQQRRKMRIEELNRLLDAKKQELGISDAKLVSNGIRSSADRVPDGYTDPATFNSTDAANLVASNKSAIASLQSEQKKLDELVAKMNTATTSEEKDKLVQQVEKQRQAVVRKENALAPVFEKINLAEYSDAKRSMDELNKSFTGANRNEELKTRADKLQREAEALMKQAAENRKSAAAEKDENKKNALLRNAFNAEKQAIEKMRTAEGILLQESAEQKKNQRSTDVSVNEESEVINRVMPDYEKKVREIESANESPARKIWEKNELNRELLAQLDKAIAQQEEVVKKAGPDEKQDELEELKDLNDIRNRRKEEIENNQRYLASNGLSEDAMNYTDSYTLESKSAQALYNEAKNRIEELKREERVLADLKIRRNDAPTESEKKKLEGEIKKQEAVVTKKENELAKAFENIHKTEIENAQKNLNAIASSYNSKSGSNPNDPDVLKAEALRQTAQRHYNDARELRAQAEKEKDINRKNALYDEAYRNERKAIEELHEAEDIYEIELPELEILVEKDPEFARKKYQREIPENVEERESSNEYRKYDELNNEASERENHAVELTDSAQTVKKKYKQPLLDEAAREKKKADELRNEARMHKDRADALKKEEDDILAYQEEQRIADEKRREEEARKQQELANATNVSTEEIVRPDFRPPDRIVDQIFVKTEKAVYSDNNPIPVDISQPKGIYFKVQVGAFRNPIPQDLFSQFAPVSGEKTGTGLTRYTVGYFTAFNKADAAKLEIRRIGDSYRDAFVVAFKDGKRIPIYDAIAQLNGDVANNTQNTNTQNTNTQNTNTQNTNTQNTNTQNTNTQNTNPDNFNPDQNNANYYNNNDKSIAQATQVEVVRGLFYTVQVGVYSKPVSADKIFNLKPLNSELTETKKIRYTTGIFTDLARASARKDEIRTIGVTDAFVTAYYNGKRITIDKARQLIESNGNSIFANPENPVKNNTQNTNTQNTNTQNTNTQNTNTQNTNTQNTNTQNTNTQNTNTQNTSLYTIVLGEYQGEVPSEDVEVFLAHQRDYKIRKSKSPDGNSAYFIETTKGLQDARDIRDFFKLEGLSVAHIIQGPYKSAGGGTSNEVQPKKSTGLKFQVYLGEYVDEVPADDAEIFLNNVDKNVKRKTTAQGYTIYYVCDCESYDDALKMKAHFVAEGITSVRVVPFVNDREITMREAFKLIYE